MNLAATNTFVSIHDFKTVLKKNTSKDVESSAIVFTK